MGFIMSAALQFAAQSAEIVTIDAIKQALIANNQQTIAANEAPLLGADHRNLVKSWMQHCERLMGVKVQVELLHCVTLPVKRAQCSDGQVIIYANHVLSAQQAVLSYHYAVVGLLQVATVLQARSGVVDSIYRDLPLAALESLRQQLPPAQWDDKRVVVTEYLAQLAQLQVNPTWLQRRESWQRSVLRMFYPSLKWTSDDLHYFIHRARRSLIKKRNFH